MVGSPRDRVSSFEFLESVFELVHDYILFMSDVCGERMVGSPRDRVSSFEFLESVRGL